MPHTLRQRHKKKKNLHQILLPEKFYKTLNKDELVYITPIDYKIMKTVLKMEDNFIYIFSFFKTAQQKSHNPITPSIKIHDSSLI